MCGAEQKLTGHQGWKQCKTRYMRVPSSKETDVSVSEHAKYRQSGGGGTTWRKVLGRRPTCMQATGALATPVKMHAAQGIAAAHRLPLPERRQHRLVARALRTRTAETQQGFGIR